MSSTTPTLQLVLTGTSEEDKNILFETWRSQMSGEGVVSNMQIIDEAIADDRRRITAIEENGVLADGYAQSVNDIPVDENGNIPLTPSDVGALYIDRENTTEGTITLVNADTLGGIPADQYVQKGDVGSFESGVPVGGTVGQILSKASDDDYDMVWIDPPTAEQSPTDPGNADTLDGKTLDEIKAEIKNEITEEDDGDADTLGGKTLSEIEDEIKTEILINSTVDADALGGKLPDEYLAISNIGIPPFNFLTDDPEEDYTEENPDMTPLPINADTLNGMTFEALKEAILAEVVYQ